MLSPPHIWTLQATNSSATRICATWAVSGKMKKDSTTEFNIFPSFFSTENEKSVCVGNAVSISMVIIDILSIIEQKWFRQKKNLMPYGKLENDSQFLANKQQFCAIYQICSFVWVAQRVLLSHFKNRLFCSAPPLNSWIITPLKCLT